MKKFEELVSERQDLLNKVDVLMNAAETAGGTLTADQEKEIEGLHAQAESLKAQIDEQQAATERAAKLKAKQEALKAVRINPIVNRLVASGPSITPLGGLQEKFRLPRNIQRHTLKNFASEEVDGRSAEERAYRFGMWAMATLTAQMPAQYRFINAVNFCADEGLLYNVHGEGGSDVSNAGIFVPDEFSYDVIRLVETYGVSRSLFPVVTMGSDTLTRPMRVSGLTAYAVGEHAAGTESDGEWTDVRLTARKWMVLTRMSSELREDAVMQFADQLMLDIALAFAQKEDECTLIGTGTSTYHGISGVRNNLDTLTAGTAPGLILGAGNAWSELTMANHTDVIAALPQYADNANTAWLCNRTYYYGVMVPLLNAAGGQTQAEREAGGRLRPIFQGYPVMFSPVMPSSQANSQIPVMLGDFRASSLFGDRRRVSIVYSDSATVGGQSMWERDQIGIKATERFDFVNHSFGSNSAAGPVVGLETASS